MPDRRLVAAFVALWMTLGVLIFAWSGLTVMQALRGAHAHWPLAALAGVEAVSAALFLVPRTMHIGAVGMLATFAIAFLAHAHRGEFRAELLLYAAATTFVLVHGPVPLRAHPPAGGTAATT